VELIAIGFQMVIKVNGICCLCAASVFVVMLG